MPIRKKPVKKSYISFCIQLLSSPHIYFGTTIVPAVEIRYMHVHKCNTLQDEISALLQFGGLLKFRACGFNIGGERPRP